VEIERSRLEFGRNRAFNREMLARYEELAKESERRERRWSEEAREGREVLRELVHQIAAGAAETRAQTKAIFRMIDRLDAGGGAPA